MIQINQYMLTVQMKFVPLIKPLTGAVHTVPSIIIGFPAKNVQKAYK